MSVRHAARVLVVDERERLLLFRLELGVDGARSVWIAPGGGLEPGESAETAARRELREETGLDLAVERCVWTRRHTGVFLGRPFDQYERYYLARVTGATIRTDGWQDDERRYLREHRWWALRELAAATAAASAEFAPRRLAALLPPLLAGEFPDEPIDCGV